MTTAPITHVIDNLLSRTTPAVEWLKRAGPVAKRLNEESKRDTREAGDSNKAPAGNHGD